MDGRLLLFSSFSQGVWGMGVVGKEGLVVHHPWASDTWVGVLRGVLCVCIYIYIRTIGEERGDLPVQEKGKGVSGGNAHPAVEVKSGDPLEGRLRLLYVCMCGCGGWVWWWGLGGGW